MERVLELSLILATVGRLGEVDRFLASLVQGGEISRVELVVVDQNGDSRLDALISSLPSDFLAVKHVKAPLRGLSFARNEGLKVVSGDVVGFPDDDCWYDSSTVSSVISFFECNPERSMGYLEWPELDLPHPLPDVSRATARKFRERLPSSIQMFFRSWRLKELGGFDENLGLGRFYGAGEETDLLLRALDKEQVIRSIPGGFVHHDHDVSVGPTRDLSSLASRQRGTGALYAKHSLDAWVIARGIVAPTLQAVLSSDEWAIGWAVSKARFEGWRSWLTEVESSSKE